MPEPADSGDREADAGSTSAVAGGAEARAEVRHLPVLAPAPEARAIDHVLAPLPAPVVAATGGFLAGVATFLAVRMLGRRRSARALTRGSRRGRELDVVATRSFLVDVHLIKR